MYIARVWHGITREADAERYLEHVQTKGIPAYRAIEGNRGAFALRRVSNGVAEFLVISLWESTTAIQRFVGNDDINNAVYYPEDRQYLGFPEPKVTHYQLAAGELPVELLNR
jgi:heme-degrading monooxygenase HmoA